MDSATFFQYHFLYNSCTSKKRKEALPEMGDSNIKIQSDEEEFHPDSAEAMASGTDEENGDGDSADRKWIQRDLTPNENVADKSTDELLKVENFIEKSCGCSQAARGKPCSSLFTKEQFIAMRAECAALDFYENHVNKLDFVIISQLRVMCKTSSTVMRSHKLISDRKRSRTQLMLYGNVVCETTFCFANGFGRGRFGRLKQRFLKYGVTEPVHQNAKRLPHDTLNSSQTMKKSHSYPWSVKKTPENKKEEVKQPPSHGPPKKVTVTVGAESDPVVEPTVNNQLNVGSPILLGKLAS